MDLKKILAIAGQPGLFQFLSQGHNSIIVESLVDKKRSNVPPTAKVNSLSDVLIFTEKEEVALHVILQIIKNKENAAPAIDPKKTSDEDLKKYFAEILPDYDRERVYLSDIKKVIAWYNVLQQNNMLDFEVTEEEETAADAPQLGEKSAKPTSARTMQPAASKISSKAAGATKISAPRKAQ